MIGLEDEGSIQERHSEESKREVGGDYAESSLYFGSVLIESRNSVSDYTQVRTRLSNRITDRLIKTAGHSSVNFD